MVILSLIYFGMGALIGIIVYAARLLPDVWRSRLRWFSIVMMGAIVSLCSGWLGVLLFGRLFSVALALWVTIACVVVVPWGITRVQQIRFRHNELRRLGE